MKLLRYLISFIGLTIINLTLFQTQPADGKALAEIGNRDSEEEIIAAIEEIEIKGWELSGETTKYIPENLYEKINGRAEYYLSYNMNCMIFARYTGGSDEYRPINLSVYDMGNPTYAFGVFSGERSSGAELLEIGRESYRKGSDIYIWHGQYYIQITTTDASDAVQKVCMELAEKITDGLKDTEELVWGLVELPVKDLDLESVQYFLIDALGYSFLTNTYTANYHKGTGEVSVFLSIQDNPASADLVLSKIKEHVNKYGKGIEIHTVEGIEFVSCNMGRYYDVIFRTGTMACGITDLQDGNAALEAAIDFYKQLEPK